VEHKRAKVEALNVSLPELAIRLAIRLLYAAPPELKIRPTLIIILLICSATLLLTCYANSLINRYCDDMNEDSTLGAAC